MSFVTLIEPPTVLNLSSLSFFDSIPPLGLAYLTSAAKDAGHQVSVIDATGESINEFHPIENSTIRDLFIHGLTPQEIVHRIPKDSEIIGISHMFLHSWPLIRDLVARIKNSFPEKIVILGGETPTAFWQHMMKESPNIDVCVLGEGERTFVALLNAIDNDQLFREIPGLVFRDENGGAMQSEGQKNRILDIDQMVLPDWEAFDVEAYLDQEYNFSSGVDRGRSMPLLATRGCPYQCTFCSSPEMWTTRYVMRNPEKVVDEIAHYVKRYRIDNIDFVDLTAIIKRRWILEFCNSLINGNVKITWQLPNGTRSEVLDQEVLEMLYRAGCRNLTYAPESGSERLLKDVKKRVKLPDISESMKNAVKVGLVANANMIIGLPGETWKDLWESYKFGMKLATNGLYSLPVMIFSPYPGSELFHQLRKAGKIELNDEYYYSSLLRGGKTLRSFNDRFPAKVLVGIQLMFLLSFWGVQYLKYPNRLFRTIYGFLTNRAEETITDNFLRTKQFYRNRRKEAADMITLIVS